MQRSMRRSTPRRSTILRGGALAALVVLGAGCAGTGGGKLLLAEGTPTSPEGVKIWSAAPGDELDDDNLVVASAQRPGSISTRLEDGTTWVNGLGRSWKGSDLLAYADASATNLISTEPGGTPDELASAPNLQTTVLRRGAYVRTSDGCLLATSATDTEEVGSGSCTISSDERWVVSWTGTDGEGPSVTIRDLRHDRDEEVDLDGRVVNAVVLASGARVLVVVEAPDGFQGVVLDATDGSEVGRTEAYPYLDVATVGAEATGFVIITTTPATTDPVSSGGSSDTSLAYVDADAKVETIDSGYYLVPVDTGSTITYLSYGAELADSSVREWSPGDDEPEVLLEGQVGAGTADGRLIVLREVAADGDRSAGVELWRPDATHHLEKVATVPAPEGALGIEEGGSGASVSRAWVRGSMLYLQLDQDSASSFVRIDMTGDHSDVPVENVERLLLESLDADGTALLTRGDEQAGDEAILIVRPHDHEAEERARFTSTGLNLIHEGVIYVTSVSGSNDAPEVSVHSLRAAGELRQELLWKDRQIAGATWPEQNGATVTSITTVGSLIAQQQQAQQQQAGAQQGVQDVTGTVPTDGAG